MKRRKARSRIRVLEGHIRRLQADLSALRGYNLTFEPRMIAALDTVIRHANQTLSECLKAVDGRVSLAPNGRFREFSFAVPSDGVDFEVRSEVLTFPFRTYCAHVTLAGTSAGHYRLARLLAAVEILKSDLEIGGVV